MEVTFVSTDLLDLTSLKDKDQLFEKYLFEEPGGHISIEELDIDSVDNSLKLVRYAFNCNDGFSEVFRDEKTILYDLSSVKMGIMSFDTLEETYKEWISISGRHNNMDEYGGLIGLIGYVNRHKDKQYLFMKIGLS